MATFSSVTRVHVLQALAEHDARGADDFLAVYGFEPLPGYALAEEGRRYDVRAVLGVAHRFATGRLATSDEVTNGLPTAIAILRKRGFDVTEPPTVTRAPAVRAPRTPAARTPGARTPSARTSTRTVTREVPVAICPTCSMALPATGRCDTCS